MRGCDVSFSGWSQDNVNSAIDTLHDDTQRMEFGAYVVNSSSSRSGGYSRYYHIEEHVDYSYPFATSHRQSKRGPEFQESWSQRRYPVSEVSRRSEQYVLPDRYTYVPPDFNNTNYRISQTQQNTTSQQQWQNNNENYRYATSNRVVEVNEAVDGCRGSGNIYEGTMVRVKVPEAYAEAGLHNGNSRRSSGIAAATVTHLQEKFSSVHDSGPRSQNFTYSQNMEAFSNNEVYGGPVSVETYRRISDWLMNCQQYSGNSLSQSTATNHPKPSSYSKLSPRENKQPAEVSSSKFANEPRIIAGLESKDAVNTGNVFHSASHQPRSQDILRAEKTPVSSHYYHRDKPIADPKNSAAPSRVSPKTNPAVHINKPFLGSELGKTSSDWSSETLSVVGSDKSSYCTDFTPFEMGRFDVAMPPQNSIFSATSDCPQDVRKNMYVSHVMVEKISRKHAPRANGLAQHRNVPTESCTSEFDRQNDRNQNCIQSVAIETKPKPQQLQIRILEKELQRPENLEANSRASHIATIHVREAPKSHQDIPDFDYSAKPSIEIKHEMRHRQPVTNASTSTEVVQNTRIIERNPYEPKPVTEHQRYSAVVEAPSIKRPQSMTRFIEKDQPLLIVHDSNSYRDSLNEASIVLRKKLESKPVAQKRNGSLSITIRPTRLTVMDYFKDVETVHNTSGREMDSSPYKAREIPNSRRSRQETNDNPSQDAEVLENNSSLDGTSNSRSSTNSRSSNAMSDESEGQDSFTRAVIKVDVPAKVVKPEHPAKLQYGTSKNTRLGKTGTSPMSVDIQNKMTYDSVDNTSVGSKYPTKTDFRHNYRDNISLNVNPSDYPDRQHIFESRSPNAVYPGSLQKGKSPVKSPQSKGYMDDYGIRNTNRGMGNTAKEEDKASPEQGLSIRFRSLRMSKSTNSGSGFSFVKNNRTSAIANGKSETGMIPRDARYSESQVPVEAKDILCDSRTLPHVSDAPKYEEDKDRLTGEETEPSFTQNESILEDKLLMSLLQNRSSDLPEFSTPHLQSQNVIHKSQYTVKLKYTEESEGNPKDDDVREKLSSYSSPKIFNTSGLANQELEESCDIRTSDSNTFPSSKTYSTGTSVFSSENTEDCLEYNGKLPPRKLFTLPPANERENALPPFDDERSKRGDDDVMDDRNRNKKAQDDDSKIVKDPVKPGISEETSEVNIKEPLYCQEFIDFPDNLLIAPPESFSDFTIFL